MTTKKEWEQLKQKEKWLKEAAAIVRVEEKDLVRTIERFQKEL